MTIKFRSKLKEKNFNKFNLESDFRQVNRRAYRLYISCKYGDMESIVDNRGLTSLANLILSCLLYSQSCEFLSLSILAAILTFPLLYTDLATL